MPIFLFYRKQKNLNPNELGVGVKAFYYNKMVSTDQTIADIRYQLKKLGYIHDGEFVVNIASMPINEQGMTNMVKISKV